MADTKRLLKIAELSTITGVPKDSIRYYVKEELLPPPRKTSRNMAYYEYGTYVPRIKLIKELQEERYLPLRAIKELLSTDGGPTTVQELDTLTQLDGKLFSGGLPGAPTHPIDRAAVSERTGVPEPDLEALESIELFTPMIQDGVTSYSPMDVRLADAIGEIWAKGYRPDTGFPIENYRLYVDTIRSVARQELGNFAAGVTGRIDANAAAEMAENGILIINRLIGILREKLLLQMLHDYRIEMEGGQRSGPRTPGDPH